MEDGRLADGARFRRAARCSSRATSTAAARSARSSRRTRRSRRWRSRRGSRARWAPDNVDFRLRQTDFRGDGRARAFRGSACRSPSSSTLERVLVIGSFLRKDHPLVAQRLRQAAQKGAEISLLHSVADDSRIRLAHSFVAAAVDAAAGARGDRRRRSAGAQASLCPMRSAGIEPAAAAEGDRREPRHPASNKGDPARQLRRAACRRVAAAARSRRRSPRSSARRSAASPRPRTASAATRSARCRRRQRRGMNARAMLARSAQGVPGAAASSRSSTARAPSPRAPRSKRRNSSS